jgi:hypothetical protein
LAVYLYLSPTSKLKARREPGFFIGKFFSAMSESSTRKRPLGNPTN